MAACHGWVSWFRQWTFPQVGRSGPSKECVKIAGRAYFISIINRARNQDEIICCACACGSEVYVDVRFNSTWRIKAIDYLLESLSLRHRWPSYSRQFHSFYLYCTFFSVPVRLPNNTHMVSLIELLAKLDKNSPRVDSAK